MYMVGSLVASQVRQNSYRNQCILAFTPFRGHRRFLFGSWFWRMAEIVVGLDARSPSYQAGKSGDSLDLEGSRYAAIRVFS